MKHRLFAALLLVLATTGNAAPPTDTTENRLTAATRLFDLPAYRVIATRQLYQSLDSLPAEQRKRATNALADPAVMTALRGVISRSMAQTFSAAELDHLARFLKADEARSMVDKVQNFQSSLTTELLAASVSDPDLMRVLLGK
ncbi:MAG: hypothetical protein ABI771_09510 [Betaproteobacteria bacterium]